ncbi:MAG: hypothetical protein CMJ78_20280 [Planctomycetaceae bacterium]|nr:hypothetical protein [Planctomycetaceae bacterium]
MISRIQRLNQWEYPIFTVRFGGDNLPVYARPDFDHCVLLFTSQENAERYIEQSARQDPNANLCLVPIDSDREISEVLLRLPSSIGHVIWDASLQAGYYRVATIQEVLEQVSDFEGEL